MKEYELKDVLYGVSNQRLYETPQGTRIGVYEIMDHQEVTYYLEHRRNTDDFCHLQKKIRENISSGCITEDSAKEDLLV